MSGSLEKLAIQQYELTTEIKRLKKLSGEIIEKCHPEDIESNDPAKGYFNHIQWVIQLHKEQEPDYPFGPESFGDIFNAEVTCPHCREWYRIQRKEILPLKRKLGSVKGAITKAGKRLATA
ncbi:hypothetical protein FEK48_13340 [Escherichia sp. E2593]|uniref:hypothetical protein n=1 Tax=unclassified Escherichia TaxID=2608889 RepID=UPI00102A0247|nr:MULTISPECIES: hypothetical protein [unclassified Escherichia]RZN40427.1 hypothetical protein D9738_13410 [Escherichia sp. E10V5]TGC06856.1 hypothetical protein CRG93_18660 [Escherichia sp. E2593]TLI81933.1 hypothetical protein FEK48_13340 [Escherichia sp. E2593]